MKSSLLEICYLFGSVTFIVGLKMMGNPKSARRGNLYAALGMVIAIFGTIFLYEGVKVSNYGWIFGGLLVGTIIGTLMAKKVKIRCFGENPSIKSSLTFLRKTPWAREQVEDLYLKTRNMPWSPTDSSKK